MIAVIAPQLIYGWKINCYYEIDCLEDNQLYKVCTNVVDALKPYKYPRRKRVKIKGSKG